MQHDLLPVRAHCSNHVPYLRFVDGCAVLGARPCSGLRQKGNCHAHSKDSQHVGAWLVALDLAVTIIDLQHTQFLWLT